MNSVLYMYIKVLHQPDYAFAFTWFNLIGMEFS